MARWKLMTSHYLNCADTVWEYKEVDRNTGRERRKQLPVPRFLDINDPGDWTNRWGGVGVARGGSSDDDGGEIVVCHEGKGEPRDITFWGDPTPDMMPLDDEAKAISASFAEHWRYKPDTAEISYSQSMVERFEADKAEIESRPQQVEIPGLADLVNVMAQSLAQNQALMEKLANGKVSPRL